MATRRILGRPSALAVGSLMLAALVACSGTTAGGPATTPTATPSAVASPTCGPASPMHYTPVVIARGFGQPDDLTLDGQGRVLFADLGNGSVNRIEPDGRITVLVSGLPEPEGLIAEPDGALLIAVQGSNGDGIDEIRRLLPGSATPTRLIRFTNATGNPGLDGISRDPRTGDILAADSPNGKVYRISPDGEQITLLAGGFVRPTDAIADSAGNVYVADEYGNKVARIAPGGVVKILAQVPLPDDLAFDLDGSLLVTSLGSDALLRLDPASGRALGTVATALHEPQGLAVDSAGNLYVSEQRANTVVELKRGCQ
jgi:serine/threonine-protein kinase